MGHLCGGASSRRRCCRRKGRGHALVRQDVSCGACGLVSTLGAQVRDGMCVGGCEVQAARVHLHIGIMQAMADGARLVDPANEPAYLLLSNSSIVPIDGAIVRTVVFTLQQEIQVVRRGDPIVCTLTPASARWIQSMKTPAQPAAEPQHSLMQAALL